MIGHVTDEPVSHLFGGRAFEEVLSPDKCHNIAVQVIVRDLEGIVAEPFSWKVVDRELR